MAKPRITIQRTSEKGQCLFIVKTDDDDKCFSAVQLQMPTHIAEWLKESADQNTDGPKEAG